MAQQHWPQLQMVTETPLQSPVLLKIIPSGISVSLLQLKLPAVDLHGGSPLPLRAVQLVSQPPHLLLLPAGFKLFPSALLLQPQ